MDARFRGHDGGPEIFDLAAAAAASTQVEIQGAAPELDGAVMIDACRACC
jgi:hypothetical protein